MPRRPGGRTPSVWFCEIPCSSVLPGPLPLGMDMPHASTVKEHVLLLQLQRKSLPFQNIHGDPVGEGQALIVVLLTGRCNGENAAFNRVPTTASPSLRSGSASHWNRVIPVRFPSASWVRRDSAYPATSPSASTAMKDSPPATLGQWVCQGASLR